MIHWTATAMREIRWGWDCNHPLRCYIQSRGWKTGRIVHLRKFLLGSKGRILPMFQVNNFPSDSLCGKQTRIIKACFQVSWCPLHRDHLWMKDTGLFGTAILLTWSKGKALAFGHNHYHFALFLPACHMASLCKCFFSDFYPDQFALSHASANLSKRAQMRLLSKRRQLQLVFSVLSPKQSFLSDRGSSCY